MTRLLGVLSVVVVSGCTGSPSPDSFDSGDAAGRMHAAAEAAGSRDLTALPELVEMLASDDPAERMVAIGALQRLTGARHGYDPTAGAESRRAAVKRWQEWLARQEAGGEAPRPPVAGTPASGEAADPATVTPRTPRTDR